jgi:hypothetical protein
MFNLPHHIMSTIPQSGRYANESIVRELEKIPEPMQLSLLDFICSLSNNYPAATTTQNETKLNDQKHYPLRGMPIQIDPEFDALTIDL